MSEIPVAYSSRGGKCDIHFGKILSDCADNSSVAITLEKCGVPAWLAATVRVIAGPIWATICAVLLPIFLLARVAIVVESFISLRHLPEGAYVAVG